MLTFNGSLKVYVALEGICLVAALNHPGSKEDRTREFLEAKPLPFIKDNHLETRKSPLLKQIDDLAAE